MTRDIIKQKTQSNDEMFDSLVKSAIDFVNSSFDDLDARPKNSIVDFYTAIELFFKARLMKEHWSLIVSKPESASLVRFQEGDFNSVTLKGAAERLRNIIGEPVSESAITNFKTLGEHRNQIVHFTHTDYIANNSSKAHVVVEQWASWHYLYELLTSKWQNIFGAYKKEFDFLNDRMMKQKEYLKVRFDALNVEIQKKEKKGANILVCRSCSFKSAIVIKNHEWGADYECMVCGAKDVSIKQTKENISCYSCGKDYEFFNKDIKSCPNCNADVLVDKLVKQCKKKYTVGDDWWDEGEPYIAYCHECEYPEPSVFYIDGLWSCASCFDRGWQAVSCPHCGKFVVGDMEKIKYFACHLCENEQRAAILNYGE